MSTVNMQKQELPMMSLSKESPYKLTVKKSLEEKIRKICSRWPNNEWSGTLFYRTEGSFETNDLHIIAVDFYLMDKGTSGFTSFKEGDTEVAVYMVENDLLDCYEALIHSHDHMSTFFSGEDTLTLQKEGADRTHFVSLIVNNAGTYCARVTRKIKKHQTITTNTISSYDTFGGKNVEVGSSISTATKDNYEIEAFDLSIYIEHVDINVDPLYQRMDELDKSATSYVNKSKSTFTNSNYIQYNPNNAPFEETAYNNWKKDIKNEKQTLFSRASNGFQKTHEEDKQTYIPFEEVDETPEGDIIAYVKKTRNSKEYKEFVDRHFAILVTGDIHSPLKVGNGKYDLESYIKNMENLNNKTFGGDIGMYTIYINSICEFIYEEFIATYGEAKDVDVVAAWAEDLCDKLVYEADNKYVEIIIDALAQYTL